MSTEKSGVGVEVTDQEKIKILTEALQNMLGVFDSPVSRMRIPGNFAEEARESGRVALEKVGAVKPLDNLYADLTLWGG